MLRSNKADKKSFVRIGGLLVGLLIKSDVQVKELQEREDRNLISGAGYQLRLRTSGSGYFTSPKEQKSEVKAYD
jgi:hypothetical protein